jgi:ABC-type sugar transport system ATPase subunit
MPLDLNSVQFGEERNGDMTAATQQAVTHNGNGPARPVLLIDGLSKTFGATRALIDASLDIKPGEIHALVGQNGSGKSTLIKTLAGYHTPDSGSEAEIDGTPFDLGHAVPEGLRFVHQDLGLVLELNAMDNLALRGGFASGAMGRVRWREQAQETHRVLARFGVDIDIHRPLAAATPVERTVVAIAAALQGWQGGSGVLVLDEPTAVLPHDEVERLFAMVREVRSAGTSVLYVSHRLDEIFELADRVTVLRGGRVIATHRVSDIDAPGLASLMVGEEVDPDYRAPVAARPDAPVVLEARDVHGRWLRGVDLDVHRGEILGIAGLAGAGVLELPYVLAGVARHAVGGRIRLPERSAEWSDVADAGDLGIALVPADRGREGIVAEFAVSENLSLSVLGRLGRRGRLDKRAEAELVEQWTERLGVVTAGPGAPISTLSGGNQQKVVVARCLVREPALLVLCEPTAGVDIGTRVAIYELIAELSRNGLTVVLSSSDAGDVLAMCTRVVVLRGGRVAAELGGEGLTEHALVSAMEGEDR